MLTSRQAAVAGRQSETATDVLQPAADKIIFGSVMQICRMSKVLSPAHPLGSCQVQNPRSNHERTSRQPTWDPHMTLCL